LVVGSELAAHNQAGESFGAFAGLFLIGLGWSCGLIAGSALLVETFSGPDRVGFQGMADMCMTAAGGVAGVISGLIVAVASFHVLSHGAMVLGAIPTLMVVIGALSGRVRKG
jgi:MFS family permease